MNKRIFIISDSLGETGRRFINAVLTQFNASEIDVSICPFIDSARKIDDLFATLSNTDLVVFSQVKPELKETIIKLANDKNIITIDLLSDAIRIISDFLNQAPSTVPGRIQKVDGHYFKRIEAIEFAVKNDDGKNPSSLLEADIVLLGISRTSKTPLSMYLAGMSYFVANIPLLPEVDLPDELFEINRSKVFGLTNDLEDLVSIREERLRLMGFETGTYSDEKRILEEIEFANSLYEELGIPIINVRGIGIEETAGRIIRILKENHS